MNKNSMKRSQRLWVIISLVLLLTILIFIGANLTTNTALVQNTRAALGGGQVTLTVDASKQVGTFSDDMLGVGYANWEHSWGRAFLGTEKTSMITNAMKEVRPGIIRYAGGNWTNAVGWTREPQRRPYTEYTVRNNKYQHHYGTNEMDALANYAQAIGADVMIEVNVTENDPQMWADMVRYTNIEKGYGFKYWEIGNENEATWNDYLSPTEYMNRFKAYKAAMEAVDPSIIVVGGGFSSAVEYSINQADNLVREMGEIAKVGDGITWHWYMEHDINTMGNFMRYTNPESSQPWDNKYSSSRQWPDYIVPRINSEQIAGRNVLHGVTELNTASENRDHLQQNHVAALMVSDALPRLAVNGVDFANFWLGFSQKGSAFAMIQHDEYNFGTGQLVNVRLNSPWYVYYMFQKYFGEQILQSQTTDKEKMSVWAAKDPAQPGKLMVWVTNFTPNAINADVAIQNFVPGSAEVYELLPDSALPGLTGNANVDIYSNLNGKKIDVYNVTGSIAQIQPKTQTVEAGGLNRTFPAYSITAFVLTGQGGAVATLTPTPTLAPNAPTYTPGPTQPQPPTPTAGPTSTPVPDEADFSTSATVDPTTLSPGDQIEIITTITARQATEALIDIEVYRNDDSGMKYFQQSYDDESLSAGQPATFDVVATMPQDAPPGEYIVKIGIFRPGWGGLLYWDNDAARFTITVPSGEPSPTPGPTSPPQVTITQSPQESPVPSSTASPAPTSTAAPSQVVPSNTPVPTQTPVPTVRPSSTSTPSVTAGITQAVSPSASPQGTVTPTPTDAIRVPQESPIPSVTVGDQDQCPRKGEGDANCDEQVNLIDFEIFRAEFLGEWTSRYADFNQDGRVSLVDAQIWVDTFLQE